jgi:hypothetical protein
MSLHGSQGPSTEKKKSKISGFKPSGRGTGSEGRQSYTPGGGASYTPGSSSPSDRPSRPSGGMKFPGLGGGGEGRSRLDTIWGADSSGPSLTSSWSDATKLGVAVLAGVLILGAVIALIFGLAKGSKPSTTTTQTNNVTTIFSPPTTSSGAKTDMPITFTDGTTADLLYDPSLDLAGLGVVPSDAGTLGSISRGGPQFEIDHGGASFVSNEHPVPPPPTVPGPSNSPVSILPAQNNSQGQNVNGDWMDFHFGDWRVGVWVGTGNEQMSSSDEQAWAQDMTGTVTPSGWLVLGETGSLRLAPYGSPAGAGPYLVFGDISKSGIILTPTSCTLPVGKDVVNNANGVPVRMSSLGGAKFEGYLCLQKVNMTADIYGPQSFVQGALDSLDIQNLKLAPARPSS